MLVVSDRTGVCQGASGKYHFIAGKPVELPDDVIRALGAHVSPYNGAVAAKPSKYANETVKTDNTEPTFSEKMAAARAKKKAEKAAAGK